MPETLYEVYWEDAAPITASQPPAGSVLYQLTGTHYVYGPDVLLYLGTTQRGAARMAEHVKWVEAEADNIAVRFASACAIGDLAGWTAKLRRPYDTAPERDVIEAIERLLIYVHQPAYNQNQKRSPRGLLNADLRIFNTGKFHRLLPELSSTRFRNAFVPPDDER